MFSQKKSFFKGKMFLFLIAALLVTGYWINKGPSDSSNPEDGSKSSLTAEKRDQDSQPSKQAAKPESTSQFGKKDRSGSEAAVKSDTDLQEDFDDSDSRNSIDEGDSSEFYSEEDPYDSDAAASSGTKSAVSKKDDSKSTASSEKSHYLVREDGGIIKIYYCEKGKKEQFIRATDIAFSLLSESDQELFRKGVVRQTEDQLSELLQDFEG